MAFTMHSHSGQFCPGHAVDQLEDIVKHAISIGYKTMGLTEHMPRYWDQDLYPEEFDESDPLGVLPPRHDAYIAEAQRLQKLYRDQIAIIIGFEAEFIRPEYADRVRLLAEHPAVDYFIGSIHHVHSIGIDYNAEMYARALAASGGSEEQMFADYYDLQYQMLEALKPRVVGHIDLIRLLSEKSERDVREWKLVWKKVKRNLKLVKEQGGWLECNSAALRKGLDEPYPCRVIAEEWIKMGGKFTVSDDSHGIAQVATNYPRAVAYLQDLGVQEVWTMKRRTEANIEKGRKAELEDVSVPLAAFQNLKL